MSFGTHQPLSITLHGSVLTQVTSHRHLGVILQEDLRWTLHMEHLESKIAKTLHLLRRIRGTITANALKLVYTVYVRPVIEYGSLALSSLTVQQRDTLERIQRRAAKVCLRLPLYQPCHHSSLLHHLSLPTLSSRQKVKQLLSAHAILHHYAPPHIQAVVNEFMHPPQRPLRQPRSFSLPTGHTSRYASSPLVSALHLFNSLPVDIRVTENVEAFKLLVAPFIESCICSCSVAGCSPP